jgi:hypothetical protein
MSQTHFIFAKAKLDAEATPMDSLLKDLKSKNMLLGSSSATHAKPNNRTALSKASHGTNA